MNRKIFFIVSGLSVVLFVVVSIFILKSQVKTPKLQVFGQVRPFSLTDFNGEQFDSRQLNGKVWVVNFIFTTCSDVCPIMSKNMASLSRSFERVPGIRQISITVNPEFDTPEKLKKYSQKFVGSDDQWYFLTGSREKIREIVVGSFKLGSVEEPIFHSTRFALVDRHGFIRGYYDGTETEEVNRLFKDAARLVRER